MKKFIIDRRTWLRGEGPSCLLRKGDKKMCCLGSIALQCGLSEEDILEKEAPKSLFRQAGQNELFSKLLNQEMRDNTLLCFDIMEINDNSFADDAEREEVLRDKFKGLDWEVEFIN